VRGVLPRLAAAGWIAAAGLALLSGGLRPASGAETGAVQVEKPWARASIGATAAAYLTLLNRGAAPDRLVGTTTPAAKSAQLHETREDGGVMRMRPVKALALAPGAPVTLKPGGLHIMLTGLARPLKPGESFPLTLRFEHAGAVTVTVPVEAAASDRPAGAAEGMSPSMGGMGKMDMGKGDMGGMQHGAPGK